MAKILLVEDNQDVSRAVRETLESEQFMIDIASTGGAALEHLAAFAYDLLILDWELPEKSGIEICKHVRDAGGNTPIIMLTGRSDIQDKESGFDSGADDYLTKPFHPRELVARVRALLRRPATIVGSKLAVRGFELDTGLRKLTRNGEEIALQPNEFALLELFMRYPDQTFSTNDLLRRCRDSEAEITLEAIYTCIRRIRRKTDVSGQPSLISTVHGSGYRLDSG